ncbi:dynein light chain Tctex-type protein 2B [Narcine bancroftii]|uniref:dynein light chain Tctex-type protein 2B n=1 Tax=Narcine bancroftii TaxID=1343680 RepID=UPI003831C46C
MGSRDFGALERLKKCRSFPGLRLPKIRSTQTSKGWGSALADSEIHGQQTRLSTKKGKEKRREKTDRMVQNLRSEPETRSTKLNSSTENLYEPRPARVFSADEVRATIRTVLEGRLNGAKYEPQDSALAAMELVECVKKAVKALRYERYKIVCYLVLGATKASALSCSSRAVWSPTIDTYAEFCFQNDSLFALCLVFALYHE